MERKIGEEFEVKLRLGVHERKYGCVDCILYDLDICGQIEKELGLCHQDDRSDGKKIGFHFVLSDESKEKLSEN